MMHRYAHQLSMCKESSSSDLLTSERTIRRHLQPNKQYKFVYCGVEKIASTFWRRLLQLINRKEVKSPYSIKPNKIMENYVDTIKSTTFELVWMLRSYKKFMFVRNPFSRLLSVYVDKLFSPNPYYWENLGSRVASIARGKNNFCGHDVTFREFLDYVIYLEEHKPTMRDAHFIPASQLCVPCHVMYDFVGKLETFETDAIYILNQLNISKYIPFLKDFSGQSIIDTIRDVAASFVDFRNDSVKCLINISDGLKRVWRKLQIRGIIAEELTLPIKRNEARVISEKDLFNTLVIAHSHSKKYDLSAQKQKYLKQAYSIIPIEIMNKISKLYEQDFRIFNYPSDLIGAEKGQEIDIFAFRSQVNNTFKSYK